MNKNTTSNDRSEQRAETARRHDDSEIMENAERGPDQQGRSGGNLQADIATQATEERVRDPEAHEGVTKEDDINHGQRRPVRHPAEQVISER